MCVNLPPSRQRIPMLHDISVNFVETGDSPQTPPDPVTRKLILHPV